VLFSYMATETMFDKGPLIAIFLDYKSTGTMSLIVMFFIGLL
jgi:hypothetical protein